MRTVLPALAQAVALNSFDEGAVKVPKELLQVGHRSMFLYASCHSICLPFDHMKDYFIYFLDVDITI